jgi:hypothetical protein
LHGEPPVQPVLALSPQIVDLHGINHTMETTTSSSCV